jgi:hypothetical protein
VKLYVTSTIAAPTSTNSYGYGQAPATGTNVLGTTTTNSSGAFSFTGDLTNCTTGQQAYIVASGGHTGSNANNTAAVLMAALGPCSSISNTTPVVVDEPTTIAAAYALSGFMTVTGNGSSAVVNISAPTNNNAATPSCTVVANVTTACSAAGLAHAFLNAANLVNSSTGAANSTITTGSGAIVATVPQLLINTLANSVEACVNSSGSASSACTTLMAYPFTSTALINTSLPAATNTLQALQYLAQYPVEASAPTTSAVTPSTSTAAFFTLANGNAYYSPALTAAPDDFTIGIDYVFSPGGTVSAPWGMGSDIKDHIYVYVAGTPTVYSLTSNGSQNWATTTGTTCGASTYGPRCAVFTDTIGNAWTVDTSGLTNYNTTTGAKGTTFTSVDAMYDGAVDVGNNVWVTAYTQGAATTAQPAPSDLEELPVGQTTSPLVDVSVGGAPVTGSTPLRDPVFDSAGNLWAASDDAGGVAQGALLMISSNNSLASPAFAFPTNNPGLYFGGVGSNLKSTSPLIDGSGNMWLSSEDELNMLASGGTEALGATNYATSFTFEYGGPSGSGNWDSGDVRYATMDGDSKIIVNGAAGSEGYVNIYYPNAAYDGQGGSGSSGANVYLNPCYVAPSTTTCAYAGSDDTSSIVNAARYTAIDASGAIWTAFSSGKNVTQILGPAAPTWGQKSYLPLALAPNLTGTATGTTSERPF